MKRLHDKNQETQKGMILASILMISVFLSVLAFAIINFSTLNLARSRGRVLLLQAQYASESGADAAVAILNSGNTAYAGTGGDVQILDNSPHYLAKYNVTVTAGADAKQKYITSVGKVFAPANATTPKYTRTVEIFSQRSSSIASSSLVGRNILYVESGVKNIQAKDLYVNGYIYLNRNTTNLIAENIIVGGRNSGAGSCSISGAGNLVKPSSFTTPGQTKTNIKMAFNNCISPPGNTSNANFDVLNNQSDISIVQSTYIPWTQYMDGTYLNAPSGCNDWLSGAFPRNIPSTASTKNTHYPDTGSGIITSCGTSGNLNIGTGQYNIRDHVHIRANLCGSSSCRPTFHNPGPTLKYIFIEGSVSFDTLTTTPTSGPLAIVSYGADPPSRAAACPYGGSFYLGNGNSTSAPKAYLLALNGLCLDKSRFGSNPAIGGLSGKNIYIATNPGSPWDLYLDSGFPTESIPIDLSWRSTRYRRL